MSVVAGTRSSGRTTTRTRRRTGNSRWTPGTIAALVVALLFAFVWLLPLAWALATALKPDAETTVTPVSWFGTTVTLDAFSSGFSSGDIWKWYFNSALVSTVVTLLTVFLGSMAAFAFSRVSFRGREILYFLIGAGLIVPFQALIVPLFEELQTFGMVDTYWGMILPQVVAPIAVLVFKRFFDGIPKELEESARLDGAGAWRIYWQIWMPLAKPATAAVAIFTFVTSWNNFLWPFIITSAGSLQTIPVGLATVQSFYGAQYAQVMALSLVGALPLFIAFVLFQRQIVEGISSTGSKADLRGARDGLVHGGAGRFDHLAVAWRQPGRVERAQRTRRRERRRPVPRGERGQREAPVDPGGGLDAAQRREGVGAEERPVAWIEEGDLAGGVSGGGVDLERADPVAVRERPRRPGARARVAAAQLGVRLSRVHHLVLGEQPGVARGDEHRGVRQGGGQRVEGADVVAVRVRERDPDDRRAQLRGGGEDLLVRAREHRVDQREPVVFPHEVRVHEAQPGQALDGHCSNWSVRQSRGSLSSRQRLSLVPCRMRSLETWSNVTSTTSSGRSSTHSSSRSLFHRLGSPLPRWPVS